MISKESLELLKQKNVSKNAEKTKTRVHSLWKPLDKARRNQILDTADIKTNTIARAYTKGTIQARLVVAFSEILEVDPLYIIGESDEQRPFDETLVIKFLNGLGYTGIKTASAGKKKKEKPQLTLLSTENAKKIPETQEKKTESPSIPIMNPDDIPGGLSALGAVISKHMGSETQHHMDRISEDDYILLLKSQFIQSNFDHDKRNRLTLIKYLLVK
jgi:hypothetical protein